jgi:hypothetical protein
MDGIDEKGRGARADFGFPQIALAGSRAHDDAPIARRAVDDDVEPCAVAGVEHLC